jgi:hypothetical protein
MANPGCEISTWVAARVLADPGVEWRKHLDQSLERIYKTTRVSTRDGLAEGFLAAEHAYLRHMPEFLSGTISLEPLVSSEPGPPVYLARRLKPEQRQAYSADLRLVRGQFEKLAGDVPEKGRLRTILRCIDNVQKDLSAL